MSVNEWTAVIIEDDPDVRELIDIVLTQSGFETVVAEDGPAGVEAVRAQNPLITTLDVNMPGMDGFAVAKRLREFSNTYLIFITSLGDEIDVVQGFEAGADDYLVKPFRPRELRARADSMLRRPRVRQDAPMGTSEAAAPVAAHQEESWAAKAARELVTSSPVASMRAPVPVAKPRSSPAPESVDEADLRPVAQPQPQPEPQPQPVAQPEPKRKPQPVVRAPAASPLPAQRVPAPAPAAAGAPAIDGSVVHFNGLTLDHEARVVGLESGTVDLTRAEFDLLASLLETGRRVRSKADLVLTMRGQQYVTSYFVNEADKRSVEASITSLRRKLGDDGPNPRFIETVRGVGYRLAEV